MCAAADQERSDWAYRMALVYSDLIQKSLCCTFRIRKWSIIIKGYTHLYKDLKVMSLI